MSKKNVLTIVVIMLTVLAGTLIAYYVVFYIPSRDKLRTERQQQAEQEFKIQLINKTEKCISNASDSRLDRWNRACKRQGEEDNCGLPPELAIHYDTVFNQDKEICIKLYD